MPEVLLGSFYQNQRPAEDTPAPLEGLLAEAHHRIANDLALISGLLQLQAADAARRPEGMTGRQAADLLGEAVGRIEAVGRLHRLLTADDAVSRGLDLAKYLHEVCDAVLSAVGSPAQTALTDGLQDSCRLPVRHALAIGLIVGELITNAVKYAQPSGGKGQIRIGCHKAQDRTIIIEVRDDGVGFPKGFDPSQDGRLGFRVLRALTKKLNAQLVFEDARPGVRARLVIPLTESE